MAHGAWAQGATNFAMVGITRGQSLQLNLVAYPPTPNFPPTPCMAQLAFQDPSGNPLGTTKTVTLTTGQSASLALNGDNFVKQGQRMEVLPIVVTEGTYPPTPCFASVEVIDNVLAITTVGVPGAVSYPPTPNYGMVGVTSFQTVRLNVVAYLPSPVYPPTPCIAQLSFADMNGNAVGKPKDVNLSPGDATFLDLPGSALLPPVFASFGQHVEVHPIVTLAVGAPTNCIASVEVYYNFNKQTTVYYPPNPCGPSSCTTISSDMTPLFPHHLVWLRRDELVWPLRG